MACAIATKASSGFSWKGEGPSTSPTVDQPVAVDLQHPGYVSKPVDAGARGSPAQDVIDEGAVDPRHFCDMGRCQAQLIGASAQAVGQGMVFDHVVPSGMWIR